MKITPSYAARAAKTILKERARVSSDDALYAEAVNADFEEGNGVTYDRCERIIEIAVKNGIRVPTGEFE